MLSVVLTGHRGMREANRRIFGRDATTDVIAQPYAPLPADRYVAAEILINVARARELPVKRRGWTCSHELALYLAHGIHHLCGADDQTPAAQSRMRRTELAWLRSALRTGCFLPLFPHETGCTCPTTSTS